MSKTLNSEPSVFGKPYIPVPKVPTETHTPVGEAFIYRADLSIKDGRKIAKVGQKLDLDAMIQAALPTTDIAAIVARAKMGDDSVLHVNPGFIGDAVNLPKDLYDYKRMNDLYDKVASSFDTLPEDIKQLFGNDASQYLNDIIGGKAEKVINDYKASQSVTEGENENA